MILQMCLDAVLRKQRFLLLLEFGMLFRECWRPLQLPLADLLNVNLHNGHVRDTSSEDVNQPSTHSVWALMEKEQIRR